jgi:hypothetical protein
MLLRVGTTQFGATQLFVQPSSTYTFSGSLNVPPGGSVTLDVYADILSSAQSRLYPGITAITGCSGSGALTFSPVSCNYTQGQDINIGGQANIQVSLDATSPPAGQLVMGSTGNNLAVFRFTETSNVEDVKITDLYILDRVISTATVKPSFVNLSLYSGNGVLLAQTSIGVPDGNNYGHRFSFSTPLIVPKSGSVLLVLKGDISSFNSSGATDNSMHTFMIATSANPQKDTPSEVVTALGLTSNNTSSVVLSSPVAYAQRVLRTKLTVTVAPLGPVADRAKTVVDDLGNINFSADSAGGLLLNRVTITMNGSALGVPSSSTFYSNVVLFDPDAGTSVNALWASSSVSTATIFFDLNNYAVVAGTTKTFRFRVNSILAKPGTAGVSQTLGASINYPWDVSYTTALSGGISGINLPATGMGAPPIPINSVTYTPGT